jgi:probable F420-dependent oxidoreductase
VKFSVSLPRPRDGDGIAQVAGMIEIARAVERIGLDACSVTDHPFPLLTEGGPGHQSLDPFVLLTHVAAATRSILVHFNLIVLPYRNPFLVARMLSTLNLVSNGRVIAAIGTGYLRAEFDALGASYESRQTDMTEGIEAMRQAWTGQPVTMTGRTFRSEGNRMQPTATTPILWRGGNSLRAIREAARGFDGWSPFEVTSQKARQTDTAALSMSELAEKVRMYRDLAAADARNRQDVALVRPLPTRANDEDKIIDDLGQLAAAGVNWLVLQPAGAETSEVIETIERLAVIAGRAGVR